MKIDFYGLRARIETLRPGISFLVPEPDVEHELPAAEAIERARRGETVLVKLWLRTSSDGGRPAVDLARLEARLAEALKPLGLV